MALFDKEKPFNPQPCPICGEAPKSYLDLRKSKSGAPMAVLRIRCVNQKCPYEREAHIVLHNLSTFNGLRKQMKNVISIWNVMRSRETAKEENLPIAHVGYSDAECGREK